MTTRRTTPSRYQRIRTPAAVAGVAALIAAGGVLVSVGDSPDTAPPAPAAATDVNPSAQTLRELRESIAGQYGSRPAPEDTINPSARVRRELRESIAGQYGPAR
jgi:hypothetical protein